MSIFFSEKLSALQPYTPGEQPRNGGYIKLNTNESPFPPSPKAVEAGRRAAEGVNLYCDPGATRLKAAIARKFGLSPDCVTVGNGSDESLAFIFAGLCPGGAAMPDVTYGFYRVTAALFGIAVRTVPLKEDFSVDTADYDGEKGTIFLANPNAPTGIALGLDKVEKLVAVDRKRLVIVDEAYVDFGAESAAAIVKKYDNLIVVRTFSKSRSLAGARLGFTLSCPGLAADIERVRNSFNPYNVNAVTLAMGEAAFCDDEYFEKTRRTIVENRIYLASFLQKSNFSLTESSANFLFASPPDGDGKRLYEELKARKILVRYFGGERTGGRCRITVGSRQECDALIGAINEIYGKGDLKQNA